MQIDDPQIDPLLEQYQEQLIALILLANSGELSRIQFRDRLAALADTFLTAAFLLAGGDVRKRQELDDLITAHTASVTRLARDVFNGTYQGEAGEGKIANRARLWTASVAGAYSIGQIYSTRGGQRLRWDLGNTEQHCSDCLRLNGIVLTRDEWRQTGWRPRIRRLECGGWYCDCRLTETDEPSMGIGAVQ